MNHYIFVYGTLKKGNYNPVARNFHQHAEFIGEGKMPGTTTNIGPYLAAIYEPGSNSRLEGHVFKMTDPTMLLEILDDYEGIGDKYPQPNEYIRRECPVQMEGRKLNCWVYLFNKP